MRKLLSVRGLLERAIEPLQARGRASSAIPEELRSLICKYRDPLFYWETFGDPDSGKPGDFKLKPGFAAGLGWALFHFRAVRERVGHEAIKWFLDYLNNEIEVFERSENSNLPERGLLVASYSAFLQWVMRMGLAATQDGIVQKVASVIPQGKSELRERLLMVLEDELIWADTLKGKGSFLAQSRVGAEFLKSLENDNPEGKTWNDKISANRLFSLMWHNEWMATKSYLGPVLEKWFSRCGPRALEAIRREQEVLDQNLQYHWWHFITQHGVWMRTWCFHQDPYKYERDRIAPGSRNKGHNKRLIEIVEIILQPGDTSRTFARRLRNCVMLVGTRTSRLPNGPEFIELLNRILDSSGARRNEIEIVLLQAIFELSRQGYLDSWAKDTSREFQKWCKERIDKIPDLHKAWSEYKKELEKVTHLDLLPNSWNDVKPKDW